MNFLILSDIHLEFHRDGGIEFIQSTPVVTDGAPGAEPIDGVILAGDICSFRQLPDVLRRFCDRYTYVVYVWGNHECYGTSIGAVRELVLNLENEFVNLHVLDNSRWQLAPGITFIGGTMWFPHDKDNPRFESRMNDFHMIKNLREEVYKENEKTVEFLRLKTQPRDIVVTHHLPSSMSVHERYEGDDLNRFFLCDVETEIKEMRPKLWVHGHTHDSFDYTIFATRVVCNPFGYPFEPNPGFRHLVIEGLGSHAT
jgi:predicted phosphodiesterase